MFILNEGGNHSRIFYLEEFLVLLLHVYRHENSLIYFCLQLFFISSTLLLPAIWQNQSVSSSHFQRRGGTGFKSPNVSRENPLEPRLQNSIWHTNCVCMSQQELSFFGLTWHLKLGIRHGIAEIHINFHNSISWFRSFNACLLSKQAKFYEQDDLQKVKLDQIASSP